MVSFESVNVDLKIVVTMSNELIFISLTKTESRESIQNKKRIKTKRSRRSKRNKVLKKAEKSVNSS